MKKAILTAEAARLESLIRLIREEGAAMREWPQRKRLEEVRRELREIEESENFDRVLAGVGDERAAIVLELCGKSD